MAIVLITGAATGIGNLTAQALARAGHTVYTSLRDLEGRNAAPAEQLLAEEGTEGPLGDAGHRHAGHVDPRLWRR